MLEGDDGEVQAFYSLLAVTTGRHHRALAPVWAQLLSGGSGGGPGGETAAGLAKVAAGVMAANGGDARFKAWGGLLMGLINHAGKASTRSLGLPRHFKGLPGTAEEGCNA